MCISVPMQLTVLSACGAKWIVIGRPPLPDEEGDDFIHHFFSDRRLFTGDLAVEDSSSAS